MMKTKFIEPAKMFLLDEKAETIDTPPRFKKPLFDYQKAVVYKILELESKRFLATECLDVYDDVNAGSPLVALTSACRLSDPFGSGKSIDVLAVIASRKSPRAVMNLSDSLVGYTKSKRQHWGNSYEIDKLNAFTGFKPEVTMKYKGIIEPSIIVVGHQVLNQWKECIKEFTDFNVFVIGSVHSLKQFYDMYKSGTIHSYDIIVIKNGLVTGNFYLDDEDQNSQSSGRPIISVVSKILDGYACPWLIYDDFDTIRIPPGTQSLHGLFTIYISTSNYEERNEYYSRRNEFKNRRNDKFDTIEQLISANITPVITDTTKDLLLRTTFNVKCQQNYIEESTKLPKIRMYICTYINPNDKYIQLLGAMGTDNATALMEGLNADAIMTVAEHVGIKTDPRPSSIFQKILEGEYEKWELDCLVLDTVERFEEFYSDELSLEWEEHPKGMHSQTDQQRLRNEIIKVAKSWKGTKEAERSLSAGTFKFLKYTSDAIERVCDDIRAEFTEAQARDGRAIDNVKSNLQEGDCQICCLELEDIVIAKCCTVVICGQCLKDGFKLRRQINYKKKDRDEYIGGTCPNCSKIINMEKDLIYVTHGFDLDRILEANAADEEESSEEEVVEEAEEVSKDTAGTDNPKLKALYEIIRGRMPENNKHTEYKVKNLLEGIKDNPLPENTVRKVLLFAGFNETLQLVEGYLTTKDIKFFRLHGTANEISRTIQEFRDCTVDSILLVNSNEICAGMNIQFATDMVFFHKIHNENIEAQVAGRAQRVGRKHNLNIFYLLYNNEEKYVG